MKNKQEIKIFFVGLIPSTFIVFLLYIDFYIFDHPIFITIFLVAILIPLLIILSIMCICGLGEIVMDIFRGIKK